jgi:predicted DNA-binding antitoxin AbrB/MazE fold protein
MNAIDAIFQDGVFKPAGPVPLEENQRVRLRIESVAADAVDWFAEMRQAREQLAGKYGTFTDTTADIAEDRRRDV